MKHRLWKSAIWGLLALGVAAGSGKAQTRVHLNTQGKAADFAAFEGGVRPWRAGTEMPDSCREGDAFFRTDLPAGHNLFVCVTGNSWKATSYDPGIGIVLAGNTLQVEDSVIPSYRTGHGTPSGNCSPGRDFYVNLDTGDLHFCSGENTWSNLRQGPHTHSAAEVVSGTLPVSRGGTGTGSAEANSLLVGNGTAWTKATLPGCVNPLTSKLLYDAATQTFTCGTDQAGSGGGGTTTTEALWLFVGSSSNTTSYPNNWAIPSTGGVTVNRLGTAPNQWSGIIFANDAEQRMSTVVGLHPLYQSGLVLTIYWYAPANSTGRVKWGVQAACTAPGAALQSTDSPAVEALAAHDGVVGNISRTAVALSPTGCAAGDLLTLRLLRDGAHASDDLVANAVVVGVQLRYTRGL